MASLPYSQVIERQRQLAASGPVPGPAPVASGPSAGAPSTSTPTSVPGSGWVNLQDYLAANPTAGQQMGQGIAGALDAQAAPNIVSNNPQFVPGQTSRGPGIVQNPKWDPYGAEFTPEQIAGAQKAKEAFSAASDPTKVQGFVPGGSGLDAYLLGASGMQPIQHDAARWQSSLDAVAGYTPPTRPPPGAPTQGPSAGAAAQGGATGTPGLPHTVSSAPGGIAPRAPYDPTDPTGRRRRT